jgi:hypothetical protein
VDAFNFVFSLFGLVLGLSLAEVLGGFARVLKLRRAVAIGWLVPLLAIFVMLDIASFWSGAWRAREWIEPHYGYLFLYLVITGLYYLAASIVFPASGDSAADFDEHYFKHRRQVLGALALCNLAANVWPDLLQADELPLRWWFIVPAYFVLIAAGMATRSRPLSIAVLAGLIGIYVFSAATSLIAPWRG